MTAWTEERISRLTSLWRKERTASQIASDLGPDVSRSAVLGKIRRLNLHRHAGATSSNATSMPAAAQPPSDRIDAAEPPASPAPAGSSSLKSQSFTPAPGSPIADLPEPGRVGAALTHSAAEGGMATILSVRRGDCRWPLGDPASPGFCLCGAPVSRGVYCATHAAIAYAAQPLRLEALLRLAGAT